MKKYVFFLPKIMQFISLAHILHLHSHLSFNEIPYNRVEFSCSGCYFNNTYDIQKSKFCYKGEFAK